MARDPYALTLWTYWHLEQHQRRTRFLERRDRFDLAGLFAVATSDGRRLADLMTEHEATAAPERSARRTEDALVHVAAHAKMTRVHIEGQVMKRPLEEV